MRAENKHGVAFRIPANPERRHNPGHGLAYALGQNRIETREAFSEVVIVCLESRVLQTYIASADPDHDLVLFNEDGRAEAGRPFNYEAGWNELSAAILALAHGPGNARLKERAAAIRAKADPGVLAALDRLGMTPNDLDADKALLQQEAPRLMALLLHTLDVERSPRRHNALRAVRAVIDAYFASSKPGAVGPKLPFGIELGPFEGGCGRDPCREQASRKQDYEISVACGMAMVTPDTRSFVRYLTR
jgi:hypothetical protein